MTEKKENGIRQRCLFGAMVALLLNEGGGCTVAGQNPDRKKTDGGGMGCLPARTCRRDA